MNYYNENDPYAAKWLKSLISGKLIPGGDVDDRSIKDVRSKELVGYDQCHFFAGIAGWPLALQIAQWPNDRYVWTGSCPCQPFSVAGKQKGEKDERHLWPIWYRLIQECRPSTIFGEQVANAIAAGWWDNVANDLEAEGYSVAAAVLPACSVGSPQKRNRLFFVANTNRKRKLQSERDEQKFRGRISNSSKIMANPDSYRTQAREGFDIRQRESTLNWSSLSERTHEGWAAEPNVGRLAYGVLQRVGKLRALGNAIVPQVAAKFIKAYIEVLKDD